MNYTLNCLNCQIELTYSTKYNMINAEKHSQLCRKCGIARAGQSYKKTEEFRKKCSDAQKKRYADGDINPFKGKTHTDEFKLNARNRQLKITERYQTDEFREKMSKVTSGEKNPMFGKTVYGIWLEKYGKEEADRRDSVRREKWSRSSKGTNNPMYGKSSPNGSGNGWKGHYNGIFFRSLRELSFMIEMNDKNIIFENGEKLKIPYISYNNSERTYRPDFILPNLRKIVEIKPARLINSVSNVAKFDALQKWCNENDYSCEIVDVIIVYDKIKELYDSGHIIWSKGYAEKFINFSA